MTNKSASSQQSSKPPVRQRVHPALLASAAEPPRAAPSNTDAQSPAAPSAAANDEKVGYRNPPKHSQFKPGFDSRRPKGRKAGAKNKESSIVAMMESPTVVRTADGGVRTMSTAQALARKLRELGLSGDRAAIAKAFELYHKAVPPASPEVGDKDARPLQTMAELSVTDQAILAAFEEEIVARMSQGEQP